MAGEAGGVDGNHVAVDRMGASRPLTLPELETRGVAIGRALQAPALVTLSGDLGAGKTTLVQAICRGLGVRDPVTSPTFALIHEYSAPAMRVVHCDLYRIDTLDDAALLGLDEMSAERDVVMLVEWPDRAGALFDAPTLAITLEHLPADPTVRGCTELWNT